MVSQLGGMKYGFPVVWDEICFQVGWEIWLGWDDIWLKVSYSPVKPTGFNWKASGGLYQC